MKILPTAAAPLGFAVAIATAALAACGSSAPATVTVTTTAPASTSSSVAVTATRTTHAAGSSTKAATTANSTTRSAATSASTTSATTSTTTTRTQTAPAFVGTNPTSGAAIGHDLAAAVAVLARYGYAPVSTSTYHAGDTLRVLIGRRPGTASERAFFFDQTIYLGTDASTPSEQISVLDENDTEVTLGYGIYRTGATTPSAQRAVRFALDMGQLSALDALPGVASRR